MKEEIFGPLLPVITTDSIDDAVRLVKSMPEPLSLYLFTGDRAVRERLFAGYPSAAGASMTPWCMWEYPSPVRRGGPGGTGAYQLRKLRTIFHGKSVVLKSRFLDNSHVMRLIGNTASGF